jgi:hypothetical protein
MNLIALFHANGGNYGQEIFFNSLIEEYVVSILRHRHYLRYDMTINIDKAI